MYRVLEFYPPSVENDCKILLEGVLEVPEGKSVMDLPASHFRGLVRLKGFKQVNRALTNLQNWFKYKKPSLSRWAVKMKKEIAPLR